MSIPALLSVPASFDKELVYYISGPMAEIEGFNYAAFQGALELCTKSEIKAMSPHAPFKNDSVDLHASRTYQWYLKSALRMQLRCDGLILLPGWTQSKGARRELDIALDLRWPVYLLSHRNLIPMDPGL